MGALELLPTETATVLKQAEEDSRGRPGATVNLAVGCAVVRQLGTGRCGR
jgi:short-chain Z-isoprenyl diphosphate synthase